MADTEIKNGDFEFADVVKTEDGTRDETRDETGNETGDENHGQLKPFQKPCIYHLTKKGCRHGGANEPCKNPTRHHDTLPVDMVVDLRNAIVEVYEGIQGDKPWMNGAYGDTPCLFYLKGHCRKGHDCIFSHTHEVGIMQDYLELLIRKKDGKHQNKINKQKQWKTRYQSTRSRQDRDRQDRSPSRWATRQVTIPDDARAVIGGRTQGNFPPLSTMQATTSAPPATASTMQNSQMTSIPMIGGYNPYGQMPVGPSQTFQAFIEEQAQVQAQMVQDMIRARAAEIVRSAQAAAPATTSTEDGN